MSYFISVTFSWPDKPDFIKTDIIGDDDWSCANYWDDISEAICNLIGSCEVKFMHLFPHGHGYILREVKCVPMEVYDE